MMASQQEKQTPYKGEASTRRHSPASLMLSRLVIISPFSSAWLALGLVLLVGMVAVPSSVSGGAFSGVLPLTAILAIASIGQMLVIMTGGIDLSVPAIITMSGTLLIGLSAGANTGVTYAVLGTLVIAGGIGLVNGILVAVGRLNPLIVTLSVGGIVFGLTTAYRSGLAQEAAVPPAMAAWTASSILGVSTVFWLALFAAVVLAVAIRYTIFGRRFQIVGGNPRAAHAAGIPVLRYQAGAYCLAGLLYGVAGLVLASFVRTPNLDLGNPYLLGPIAAVVIAGTSLQGGTASVLSTFAAAFFLTQLSQALRIVGLSSAWQYVVFGLAIAIGMLISGDRILALVGGRLTSRQESMTW
jgi:ribose transport system permease protein